MAYRLTEEQIELGLAEILKHDPSALSACVDAIYRDLEGYKASEEYHEKHMTSSSGIITVADTEKVIKIVTKIEPDIRGKVVVEIGAGIGLLSVGMATMAKQVYAIEIDPAWSWAFVKNFYKLYQPNLTFIFGKAESMIGLIKADVAIIVTNSGHKEMQEVGSKLAKKVIDVYETYGELRGNR